MGRTELKPTPKNLHYKKNKTKSKLTPKVLFKRKLHITHACILERWNAIHRLHTMVDIENHTNFLYGFYLYPEIKLVQRSWKKEKHWKYWLCWCGIVNQSSFHVLILPESCKVRLQWSMAFNTPNKIYYNRNWKCLSEKRHRVLNCKLISRQQYILRQILRFRWN